jgi:hypothetical protein
VSRRGLQGRGTDVFMRCFQAWHETDKPTTACLNHIYVLIYQQVQVNWCRRNTDLIMYKQGTSTLSGMTGLTEAHQNFNS